MPLPEQYNPPLTIAGHLWRTTLCLVISAVAWAEVADEQWEFAPWLLYVDLALGVLSLVLVFWRRRWPFAVALVTGATAVFSMSAAGPSALAFVSLATHRRLPQIVVAGVVGALGGQLFYYIQPAYSDEPPWLNFAFIVAMTVAMAAIGMYLGSRRELLWSLTERARQAEAQQALRVDQAKSAERERIAREMHDVLAHRISLVAMHAGALAYRDDLPPEQVRETAALIRAKSHEAMADLRQVLGMLRDEELPHRPQPTLADLRSLVEEAATSGLEVDLADSTVEPPPEQVGRTVYRIVQEGLTNARKHGGGAAVQVRVEGGPGRGVSLLLHNRKRPAPGHREPPPSGLGLVGLRERAELNGGWLRVEETAESFSLKGWLPWPA